MAARVPHNSSRTSVCESDPESVGRIRCPVARGWFYSKTNGFLTFSVARSVKPMVFLPFLVARSVKPFVLIRFRTDTVKPMLVLLLFRTDHVKHSVVCYCFGPIL